MEVGQAVLALNLVDAELDLAEGVVLILLEIGERNLEYPALESIVGVLETGGSVDEGLSDAAKRRCSAMDWIEKMWANLLSDLESSRSLHIVPILLGESIGLLLETLLSLGKTLVLADSHDCDEGWLGVAGREGLLIVVVDLDGEKRFRGREVCISRLCARSPPLHQ